MNQLATLGLAIAIMLWPTMLVVRWLRDSARVGHEPPVLVMYIYGAYLAAPLLTGGAQVSVDSTTTTRLGQVAWLSVTGASTLALAISRAPRSRQGSAHRLARLALLLVFGTQVLSSAFSGRLLSVNLVLPALLVILVITEFPLASPSEAINLVRRACLMPIAASLAAFALDLPWAYTDQPLRTPNPFTDVRVEGVFAHPNALGSVAAIAFIAVLARPPRLWAVQGLAAGMALWLSDARTMILVTTASAAIILLIKLRLGPRTRGLLVLSGLVAGAGAVASLWTDQGVTFSTEVSTFNGRTELWQLGLNYWSSSPVIGVGQQAFDSTFREATGLTYAGQAHNQLVQTLAGEGLIGAIALIAAALLATRLAYTRRKGTAGASAALGLVLLALCSVESPLRAGRLSSSLFVTVSAFIVLLPSMTERSGRTPGVVASTAEVLA